MASLVVRRPAPSASPLLAGQTFKLLSWNLLAPPYKRMGGGVRESDRAFDWQARARTQIEYVAEADADIVGLQEFWTDNAAFVGMWREFADLRGYHMFVSPRTRGKADGLCMLVRDAIALEVDDAAAPPPSQSPPSPGDAPAFSCWSFNDWGDRVVQLLRLPIGPTESLALLHTHLTFPHPNDHDGPMRRRQAGKMAEAIGALRSRGVLVFGDMNGDVEDEAVDVLQTMGGLEAMAPAGGERWISHVAHNGAHMACDLLLSRGDCRVPDWSLGFTQDALLANAMCSDHRPLLARVTLEAEPEVGDEPTMM
eukprot:4042460-Prymnesium_polylepis.1